MDMLYSLKPLHEEQQHQSGSSSSQCGYLAGAPQTVKSAGQMAAVKPSSFIPVTSFQGQSDSITPMNAPSNVATAHVVPGTVLHRNIQTMEHVRMRLPWLLDKFLQSAFKLIYIPLHYSFCHLQQRRIHYPECIIVPWDTQTSILLQQTSVSAWTHAPPPPPPKKKKKQQKKNKRKKKRYANYEIHKYCTTEERQQVLCLYVLGFILHSLNVQYKLFHLIQMGVLLRSFILVFFASEWSFTLRVVFQCIL